MAAIEPALAGLAWGRIGLGVLARAAPRPTTSLFGAGDAASPELDYMLVGAAKLAGDTGSAE
jgi:hypothetical protein